MATKPEPKTSPTPKETPGRPDPNIDRGAGKNRHPKDTEAGFDDKLTDPDKPRQK